MATAPRSRCRWLTRSLLAALCLIASGCGGDDGSSGGTSDIDRIRVAIERVMESESVEDQCERGVSERFVREVYGTLARCREVNKPDGDEAASDSATISQTRIDGDRATTGVALTSAKGARARGRVALVKVDDAWKVDRLGIDFLRSVFQALPKQAATADERLVLGCLAEASRDLPDRELRRVGNLMIGQRLEAESFPPAALRCIRRGTGPTTTA